MVKDSKQSVGWAGAKRPAGWAGEPGKTREADG